MVEEGAWPEQVDAALESFGFAMGPFAVADLSGLDIAWRMRQAQGGHAETPAHATCTSRTGSAKPGGWDARPAPATTATVPMERAQVDEAVHALIEQARADKRIVARRLADEEICRRAMLSLVNEAALLLAEGVAERATDVDVALVNGYGFPRWEGGPVFWARERARRR